MIKKVKSLPAQSGQKLKISGGFTLIELLIVVSILALLMGVSLFGLRGSRESGRDAVRQADLESIRSALEIYRADCSSYPSTGGAGANITSTLGSSLTGADGGCGLPGNTYLDPIPNDILSGRYYRYYSNGSTYQICSNLEQGTGGAVACGSSSSCGSGVTCNYRVTNP